MTHEDDVSTSQENYESGERKSLISNGRSLKESYNKKIDKREGFCFSLRKNCKAIGRAILMREIYQLVIFFIGRGILIPTFEEFQYFFLLDVIHISKLMFAMLVLVA